MTLKLVKYLYRSALECGVESGRRASLARFSRTAPIAIPGIVLGVGLFLSYTRPPFVLYGTLWILLMAFLTISLPSTYQQLQANFRTIHPELEEASRILGATRLRALRQITAPLMRTGVIATWCFIFVGVMRELSAAIILFTSETKAVSVLIFDLNESGDLGAIAVNYVRGRNRGQPDSRVWLRRPAQQLSGQGSIDPMNPPILLQVSRRRLGPLWVNIRRRR